MLTRLGLLLLAAVLAGTIHSALVPVRLGQSVRPAIVSLPEALDLYADPSVVFIDASSTTEFQRGHIPGAISLPLTDLAAGFPQILERIAHQARIMVYCSGPSCDAAVLVALRLRDLGFLETVVFEEGLTAWKSSGAPVESSF